jgi:HPt (histidine-containing phosphotransfer) domain-containing protein
MSHSLLDEGLLSSYLNHLGKDIIKQMIELYQQQSKIYLDDISRAVNAQSTFLWQEHCHKMKGAAGTVGLKVLHRYLMTIEKSAALSEDKSLMIISLKQHNDLGIAALIGWLNAV